MVINHKYRFCFFAIPRTASKAITHTLLKIDGSKERMPMHMGYAQFLESATDDEQKFFKFASIRNPLDSVVSAYFKKLTDHNDRFSRGTFKKGKPIAPRALEEYHFIHKTNSDFPKYFKTFHQTEYKKPKHEETIRNMDDLIRFEDLELTFERILKHLSLPVVGLEKINTTRSRTHDFTQYFDRSIIPLAKETFGRIMDAWDYSFPVEWEPIE